MARRLFFRRIAKAPVFRRLQAENGGIFFKSPRGVLAFEGKIVSDHGDKFWIRRFSLDAAYRIAEEPLQGLHIAAVPGHLDGVADFGTFVPKRGRALVLFPLETMAEKCVWFIALFVGVNSCVCCYASIIPKVKRNSKGVKPTNTALFLSVNAF